ncbi:uncharacterized protein LOC142538684 [Primulina tabacum]|uniref:uncharacterized protein LOC142538684 n=1 Tax=Primulina tabacum TaxID=48773 RepID=UPI003F59C34C
MPSRRDPSVDRQDDIPGGGRGPPPLPPPLEAATQVLEFRRLNPKEFGGTTDPFLAEGWIRSLELHFEYLQMGDGDRSRCAIYMLRDDVSLWWERATHAMDLATLTWARFKELFYGKFFPTDIEFMSLCQGDSSVAEFIPKFDRGCHFVLMIARDADQKLKHFSNGLRPTLRRDVMLMRPA